MSGKKPLRVGHVGTKHAHSADILRCLQKFPEEFEVVGIAEEDPRRQKELASLPLYAGLPLLTEEQLLNAGCDCVVCEGFEYDLPRVALRFLEAGIPVHMDKPAGWDLSVFEAALRTAKKKQLPLQLGYMYRYNPAIQDCFSMADAGRLGDIRSVTAVMNTNHPLSLRKWLGCFDAGIMFFLGCHMVDLIYRLQGTPEEVIPCLTKSGFHGNDSIDGGTALFRYRNGVSIARSDSTDVASLRRLTVSGSLGTYEIEPLEYDYRAVFTEGALRGDRIETAAELRRPAPLSVSTRYDAMMLDFAAMVRGEKENPYSYEYELQCQRLVLAACGQDVDIHEKICL